MKNFKNALCALCIISVTPAIAAETPLCALPQVDAKNQSNNAEDINPACPQILNSASKIAQNTHATIPLVNSMAIPPQLSVGAVYLQPITMSPAGMMLPRNQSDIHLEMDVHAKTNLKARGFAPGDWLPNVDINYTIQKIGDSRPLNCGGCKLMPMVASDGAHYGDNVKLKGPGFYVVTFEAKTSPNFGWHTDTDTKILGTEFVDWHFKQSYLFKWSGLGKLGGY
ncbi:MAG: iron transporter [Proteobacteria bacterium]|nr:iron transporter [Pseudomonadota bacterium]